MGNVDDRILKVKCPKAEGWRLLPFLPLLPEEECVFDFFHGTVGFDVFPRPFPTMREWLISRTGGGHFPCTGVLEYEKDSDKHDQHGRGVRAEVQLL